MVAVVTGRAGGRVGRAVWAGGHVGAHLGQLGRDQLQKKTKKTLKVNEQTHQLDLTELFLKTIFKI